MTNEKKLAELFETSLICFLGALVAMLGFLLVWLLCSLAGLAHSKSKWLVNRLTLLGEKLRPILSNVQTIFEPDPKLSINHYCWLITETHSWLNRRLVTPNEVCPLMTIQADPMSGSMR